MTTSTVSESLDAESAGINWYDFLRNKVNSFIKWDLVRFFHDNPHARDTVDNLARYTGRDIKTIERELNGLVTSDMLKTDNVGAVKIYSLSENVETRRLISAFMEACQDREFRVKAIHHVIRGMQFTPRHDF